MLHFYACGYALATRSAVPLFVPLAALARALLSEPLRALRLQLQQAAWLCCFALFLSTVRADRRKLLPPLALALGAASAREAACALAREVAVAYALAPLARLHGRAAAYLLVCAAQGGAPAARLYKVFLLGWLCRCFEQPRCASRFWPGALLLLCLDSSGLALLLALDRAARALGAGPRALGALAALAELAGR
jgi:hypothetical protein